MFHKPNSEVFVMPEKARARLNLCKNCRFFARVEKQDVKFGKCKLFGSVNIVDGSIEYLPANVARDFHCKDDYFDLNVFD